MEREIDQLVAPRELYWLTEEEIKIVERNKDCRKKVLTMIYRIIGCP